MEDDDGSQRRNVWNTKFVQMIWWKTADRRDQFVPGAF